MSTDITTGEIVRRSLAENEEIIERGLVTFFEVGAALSEIRDAKLYKARYGTFDDYCRERWGWTDQYARNVIAAAEIQTIVGVENEGQARALGPLKGDQDAMKAAFNAATAKAEAEGAKLTASRITEAVNDILEGECPTSGSPMLGTDPVGAPAEEEDTECAEEPYGGGPDPVFPGGADTRSKPPTEQEIREAEHKAHIGRCRKRLEKFLDGWDQFIGLASHPDRDEILDTLTETDRDRLLSIEKELFT